MAELVVYPDAHPEVTSVDGWVREYDSDGLVWADIRGGAGYDGYDGLFGLTVNIQADAAIDKWQSLIRAIMLFDTSRLPDDCIIDSATLRLWGRLGYDKLGITPSLNIYSSNPALDTAIVAGDFDSLGDSPLATAILHADWNPAGPNVFTLNAAGLATISKTGITKLGARLVCDAENAEPAWLAGQLGSTFNFYGAEPSGGGYCYPPKLTITYPSGIDSVDETIIGNKVSLEAIRNLEIVYGGRFYIGKSGNAIYESRYHRNV